jgi:WD40 repeat protein
MSDVSSTNPISTAAAMAAGMQRASSTGLVDNPFLNNATTQKLPPFKFSQELNGHRTGSYSVTFSPDRSRLVSGSDDTIRIWADRQGKFEQVQELEGHARGSD